MLTLFDFAPKCISRRFLGQTLNCVSTTFLQPCICLLNFCCQLAFTKAVCNTDYIKQQKSRVIQNELLINILKTLLGKQLFLMVSFHFNLISLDFPQKSIIFDFVLWIHAVVYSTINISDIMFKQLDCKVQPLRLSFLSASVLFLILIC